MIGWMYKGLTGLGDTGTAGEIRSLIYDWRRLIDEAEVLQRAGDYQAAYERSNFAAQARGNAIRALEARARQGRLTQSEVSALYRELGVRVDAPPMSQSDIEAWERSRRDNEAATGARATEAERRASPTFMDEVWGAISRAAQFVSPAGYYAAQRAGAPPIAPGTYAVQYTTPGGVRGEAEAQIRIGEEERSQTAVLASQIETSRLPESTKAQMREKLVPTYQQQRRLAEATQKGGARIAAPGEAAAKILDVSFDLLRWLKEHWKVLALGVAAIVVLPPVLSAGAQAAAIKRAWK